MTVNHVYLEEEELREVSSWSDDSKMKKEEVV